MSVTVTSAPASEPISTAEAKEWLRIDTADSSQDAVLAILIKTARQKVEEFTRRAMITQTLSWEAAGKDVARQEVELPRPPVQSVTSFTVYNDVNGSETSAVVGTSNYQLTEGSVIVERNTGWDINRANRAATIVYVTGYGDASTDVPAPMRFCMLKLLALYYERRGDEDRDFVSSREQEILEDIRDKVVYGY